MEPSEKVVGSELPRISVVISVLDAAATIERCLASVFGQTYADREIVVMDGGSTDGTRDILGRSEGRIDYWESAPDRGIYHAWNKAMDRVTGDWICFLGADDTLWRPDSLARIAAELGGDGRPCAVVYASVHVVGPDGSIRTTVGRPWAEVREDFRHRMAIPHQATFHHRSLFERHGRFDESFRICGDYEFLLRELVERDARFVPDQVVTAMGSGGVSDRPGAGLAMTREFERARRMHGLTRLPRWLSPPLFRANCRDWITRHLGAGAAEAVAGTYRFLIRRPRV